jgi:hypothetical protein
VLVFRSGSLTPSNLTPRPDKDTVGPMRGLSFYDDAAKVPGKGKLNVRVIDTDKLAPPLGVVRHGGGHVSIVPLAQDRTIDDAALERWAAARGTDETHELTQRVLDAVVDSRVLEKEEP